MEQKKSSSWTIIRLIWRRLSVYIRISWRKKHIRIRTRKLTKRKAEQAMQREFEKKQESLETAPE
jgi:hypothetical protein